MRNFYKLLTKYLKKRLECEYIRAFEKKTIHPAEFTNIARKRYFYLIKAPRWKLKTFNYVNFWPYGIKLAE